MPIYEYECRSCRHRFEVKQGFTEVPEARCPICEGRACRVFHPAPVIFKGSGFYVTDYRKGKDTETDKPKEDHKPKEKPAAKSGEKE